MEKVRNAIIYLLIFVVLFGVGIYIFDQYAMMLYVRHGQSKPIPDLVGQEVEAAKLEAQRLGFGLRVLYEEHSEEYPSGFVALQIPGAGSFSKRGRTIKVVKSLGNERAVVPDIIDNSIREAEIALNSAKITLGNVKSEYNDDILEAHVIKTNPAPGETLFVGEEIDIVVSLGSRDTEVQVPNFIGMDVEYIDEMKDELELGIVYKYRRIPSIRENTVYKQSVDPGTLLPRGSVVTLLVSQGAK
ncbi:MAG: PASTA domain-containing protein [Candidatus Zixiibacteriota bacterium]